VQTVPLERRSEVSEILTAVARWAQGDDRVSAVGLAGSWASGAPTAGSDLDLVVLSPRPAALLDDRSWFDAFGAVELVRAGRFGAVAERRLRRPSGLEVEVCVAASDWAATDPVDPGTRQVVSDGFEVVFDPRHLLEDLVGVVHRRRR
jgi:uncharacterized protein